MTTETDETRLSEALHDRVRDERPDPERIIRVATATHARRLRRKRIGGTLAVAACVGALAVGVPWIADQDDRGDVREETGYAAPGGSGDGAGQPTRQELFEQVARLVRDTGSVAQINIDRKLVRIELDELTEAERAHVTAGLPDGWLLKDAPETASGGGTVPVELVLDGWSCEEFPVDDKSWCTGPGGEGVSVNWRPAAEHDSFTGKYGAPQGTVPMLGGDGALRAENGATTVIGPVKGEWFISLHLQPGAATDPAVLAAALSWK